MYFSERRGRSSKERPRPDHETTNGRVIHKTRRSRERRRRSNSTREHRERSRSMRSRRSNARSLCSERSTSRRGSVRSTRTLSEMGRSLATCAGRSTSKESSHGDSRCSASQRRSSGSGSRGSSPLQSYSSLSRRGGSMNEGNNKGLENLQGHKGCENSELEVLMANTTQKEVVREGSCGYKVSSEHISRQRSAYQGQGAPSKYSIDSGSMSEAFRVARPAKEDESSKNEAAHKNQEKTNVKITDNLPSTSALSPIKRIKEAEKPRKIVLINGKWNISFNEAAKNRLVLTICSDVSLEVKDLLYLQSVTLRMLYEDRSGTAMMAVERASVAGGSIRLLSTDRATISWLMCVIPKVKPRLEGHNYRVYCPGQEPLTFVAHMSDLVNSEDPEKFVHVLRRTNEGLGPEEVQLLGKARNKHGEEMKDRRNRDGVLVRIRFHRKHLDYLKAKDFNLSYGFGRIKLEGSEAFIHWRQKREERKRRKAAEYLKETEMEGGDEVAKQMG